MERSGIICGGAWCIDRNIVIDHWPAEETLAAMLSQTDQGGCPGHNMSTALKRLGALFPVEAIGLVGDDADGRMLLGICDAMGIERSALAVRQGASTPHVLAMTAKDTGKRTFFYTQGTHALQTPDDFDFSRTGARIAHLGLPGLHEKLDAAWNGEVSGWVAVLKKARALGIKCNMELASIEPARIHAAAAPMLPYLDMLIINDFEAGAIAGIETVKDGVTDRAACRRAAEQLMAQSALSFAAIHYPLGGIVLARGGAVIEHPSVAVPRDAVAGSNGAGDSFAAGMLFGVHEGWPLERSLRLAHASAASSLRAEATTAAILPWAECLALADRWGWRQ